MCKDNYANVLWKIKKMITFGAANTSTAQEESGTTFRFVYYDLSSSIFVFL